MIFEGFLRYLHGESDGHEVAAPAAAGQLAGGLQEEERAYGYCTEFIIEGERLDAEAIREQLEAVGQSVLVVEDESLVRAHVHTFDPEAILGYANSLGTLRQVKVQNMDEQHEDFIALEKPPQVEVATVAVASGEGIAEVFRSLGVTDVIMGGQTMNPSTEELLRVVGLVPSDKVILLPNNANIVLAAEQARELSAKRLEIVPAETIPQGVAALLAFSNEADLAANVSAMNSAISAVRTVEVTAAVRPARIGELVMEQGQPIAFLDGELVQAGDSVPRLVQEVISQLDLSGSEIITIYYGADTAAEEAESLSEALRQRYPRLEVEAIYGGQPHYNYILSVE